MRVLFCSQVNFTDACLSGLSSARWHFAYRLLDVVAGAAIVDRTLDPGLQLRKCGEKSITSEHNPIFCNKTAGRGSVKPVSGRRILVFPALPESPHGSMRQIPEPPSTPPFSRKETAGRSVAAFRCGRQFDNLPHTSGLSSIRDGLRHFCVRPADCFRS